MDDTPTEVTLRYEMGCVPADIHRLLPLVAPVEYDAALNQFIHTDEGRTWHLRLLGQRERRIAGVRLPVLDVEFAFHGYTQSEVEAATARFFTYFNRGGG